MKKTRNILLAMSYYHPQIHEGVARYAAEHGWHLNAKMTITGIPQCGWRGDGVIVQGPNSSDYYKFVNELDLPKVSMGSYDKWGCPVIDDDHEAIGVMAAEYFLGRGFENFAVYSESTKQLALTQKAFCSYLGDLNKKVYEIRPESLFDDWQKQSTWLAEELERLPKPLAVFCDRDHGGAEVIDTCMQHGIAVPWDVSVLGKHNNALVCDALAIPLSSLDNNLSLMGYKAADNLGRILDSEEVSPLTLIPPREVITRASTELLAVNHEHVRRALIFIQGNYRENIGVDEVVATTGMSVRGLQQAFNKQLGHGIGEVIFKHRIDRAKELLLHSEWTIETVARESGFFSMRNFFTRFKKVVGMTPHQFRKVHHLS